MAGVKLKLFGSVVEKDGGHIVPIIMGKGSGERVIELELPETWDYSASEPVLTEGFWPNTYLYRNRIVQVIDRFGVNEEELMLRLKYFVFKQDKDLDKLKKEVGAYESFTRAITARREKISDDVRMFVWQRDGGKCVKCGSNEKLEFDHIIPIAKGGANTTRNIQLLCEQCNRAKGSSII